MAPEGVRKWKDSPGSNGFGAQIELGGETAFQVCAPVRDTHRSEGVARKAPTGRRCALKRGPPEIPHAGSRFPQRRQRFDLESPPPDRLPQRQESKEARSYLAQP